MLISFSFIFLHFSLSPCLGHAVYLQTDSLQSMLQNDLLPKPQIQTENKNKLEKNEPVFTLAVPTYCWSYLRKLESAFQMEGFRQQNQCSISIQLRQTTSNDPNLKTDY